MKARATSPGKPESAGQGIPEGVQIATKVVTHELGSCISSTIPRNQLQLSLLRSRLVIVFITASAKHCYTYVSRALHGALHGPYMGPTWAYMGPTWALHGPYMGPTWPYMGPTWALHGPYMGPTWALHRSEKSVYLHLCSNNYRNPEPYAQSISSIFMKLPKNVENTLTPFCPKEGVWSSNLSEGA